MNGRDDSEGVVASSFFRSVWRLCPACLRCNLADLYLLFWFTAPPTSTHTLECSPESYTMVRVDWGFWSGYLGKRRRFAL